MSGLSLIRDGARLVKGTEVTDLSMWTAKFGALGGQDFAAASFWRAGRWNRGLARAVVL
jgi:hypothetical protein